MRLFNFLKKKPKAGKTSNISKLRTPYLVKDSRPFRGRKRLRKEKPVFKPPKIKTPSTGKGKKILALILSLGIFTYVIYALFFSNYFLVTKYTVEEEGVELSDNIGINKIMDQTLRKNLVTYDPGPVKEQIRKEHPEIESIVIKKIFPSTISVSLEKYPTAANIVDIVNGMQKKFLVNNQGLLIEENTENPDLPYIRVETKEALPLNQPFLGDATRSARRLKYALQAMALFEEKFGIRILYAVLKPREREIHLYTEKYFYVMLDMEKGAPEVENGMMSQIEKLKKALPKLDIYNTPLVYIDLRISGTNTEKVIYKRK